MEPQLEWAAPKIECIIHNASQAVLIISEHNLKHHSPPHCLLAASCRKSGQMVFTQCPQLGRYATLCTPRGAWGSFLLADGTGVCTETVCSPACLEGPAVPVNTAELWGPHTCRGQVQVSWDVFMWVRVGGVSVFVCMHSLCIYKKKRGCNKGIGLWRLWI